MGSFTSKFNKKYNTILYNNIHPNLYNFMDIVHTSYSPLTLKRNRELNIVIVDGDESAMILYYKNTMTHYILLNPSTVIYLYIKQNNMNKITDVSILLNNVSISMRDTNIDEFNFYSGNFKLSYSLINKISSVSYISHLSG